MESELLQTVNGLKWCPQERLEQMDHEVVDLRGIRSFEMY